MHLEEAKYQYLAAVFFTVIPMCATFGCIRYYRPTRSACANMDQLFNLGTLQRNHLSYSIDGLTDSATLRIILLHLHEMRLL